MGIGTSLGAYFESPFHQEAGIDTPPEVVKPKDTGDDNVLPPDSDSQIKSSAPQPVADMKTASPLVTITDEDIEKGISLGLATSGGGLSLRKSIRPEPSPEPVEGPNVFQQFMAGRGRSQPSNIVETPSAPEAGMTLDEWAAQEAAQRQSDLTRWSDNHGPTDHPDFTHTVNDYYNSLVDSSNINGAGWQPRGIRPDESLRAFAEREVEHADPNLRMNGHAIEHSFEQEPYTGTEADLQRHLDEHVSNGTSYGRRAVEEAKRDFEANADKVISKGNMSLLNKYDSPLGNLHQYHFMNGEGNIGELSVRERQGGKELYVPWIGTVAGNGVNTIGRSEVRNLLNILKDQFPKAETITGFRVSGARNATGKIGDASMRLRPATEPASTTPPRLSQEEAAQVMHSRNGPPGWDGDPDWRPTDGNIN